MLDPRQADELPGDVDPALRSEIAHTTAGAIVHQGRSAGDDPALVARLVGAAGAQLPALAVVAGVAVLVLGAAPRAFGLAWAFLGYVALTAMLGGVLPDGSDLASPLRFTPMLPAEPMDWPAVLVLAALAAALLTGGVRAFCRRDLVA